MRFLKSALILTVVMAFAASAWACDKDHSTKAKQVKQVKQQTASVQPVKTDQPAKKPHGG